MDNEALNRSEEFTDEENINGENMEDDQSEIETPEERKAREEREERERAFRAKKRRLIPPIIMLSAGAAVSITMRILHYETKTMLIILLCVLVGFYMAGCIMKEMLDRFERQIEQAEREKDGVIEKELAEEDRPIRRSQALVKDE